MVVLVAGAMVVVLGFGALAIDLGFLTETHRGVQNDADAMALAGVQELARRELSEADREAAAAALADDWAVKNDVDDAEIVSYEFDVTCEGDAVADTMTVRLKRTQKTFLAGVLGIGDTDLYVCATARTGMARGGPGLLPIGLLNDDPEIDDICFYDDGTGQPHADFYYDPSDGGDVANAPGGDDEKCVIKIPTPANGDTWANGNTGPIRTDEQSQVDPDNYRPECDPGTTNSGAEEFSENIEVGSDCPYAVGDRIRPLPGSQTGQTCTSFDEREAEPHMDAHELSKVFWDPELNVDGIPVYQRVDENNPHFGILPVTTLSPGGSGWIEIIRFVTVYIVGCEQTGNGNTAHFVVTVIPVASHYFAEGQDIVEPGDPDYSSDWPAFTIKLIE